MITTGTRNWLMAVLWLIACFSISHFNVEWTTQAAAQSGSTGKPLSVAQAINVAKKTGRPIFAVAGANYCPACKKLLNTLNTEESLRPLLGQFVPLKINAQSQEYARWKQFFPPERAAIPALFIVNPQGEQLYGKVGALPSKNLRTVMLTSLEKAGRYPSKQQWQEIAETLNSTEKALAEDKVEEAAKLLLPYLAGLEQLGPLLQESATGKKAGKVVEQLIVKQRKVLDQALYTLEKKGDFEAALQVAVAEKLGSAFPDQKAQVKLAIKKGVSDSEHRKLLRQAREFHQAELMAKEDASKRKAVAALKRIVRRYPNSDAASKAQEKLLALAEST